VQRPPPPRKGTGGTRRRGECGRGHEVRGVRAWGRGRRGFGRGRGRGDTAWAPARTRAMARTCGGLERGAQTTGTRRRRGCGLDSIA
jgi:hypothetical protein